MLAYTILLYESDPRTARHFSGIATELGMSVIEAQTPEQVHKNMDQHFFELALVNIHLPPVELHPETKCIAYGDPDEKSLPALLRLRPSGIIARPYKSTLTQHLLTKISGLTPAARSLPCLFIEVEALLREKIFSLKSLLNQPEYLLSFKAFPERYCGIHCSFATPAQDIPPGENDAYDALGTTTERGHMVCAYKKDCRLFLLASSLEQEQHHCRLPAATLLTAHQPGQITPSAIAARLKQTAEAVQALITQLLEARHKLCLDTCHILDENGIKGSRIKKKCCGFGCVLDNYFDLTPPKEVLTHAKALIYDNDTPETKTLIFLCKDFGMEPHCTSNANTAQQLLSTARIPFAFINPELDRISIPHNTRVIIVDELSIGMIARILAYRPVGIIPKPIDIATLSIAFTKALNIPFTQESFLSLLNNVEMQINASYMAINSWLFDEIHKYSLDTSIKYFCENYCSCAATKGSIDPKDLSRFYLLNPFSKRGALYCQQKPKCKLWKLHADVLIPSEKDLSQSPADFLRGTDNPGTTGSLIEHMEYICEQAGERAEELNRLRQHFCMHSCDKKCADFKIKKGDVLFSSLSEILANNVYVYCKEHDCPVIHFFTYFRRVMA